MGKLILLEGWSGAGKSTTATHLALHHQHLGLAYRYHWELEVPHPVNMRTGFTDVHFTLDERIKLGLAKWRSFVEEAQTRDSVTLFDGKPLHILLLHLILHNNVTRQQIVDYTTQIAELIRPLAPKLIYLRQSDSQTAAQRLEQSRGEGWIDGMLQMIEHRRAGQVQEFSGRDGLLRYIDYYRELMEAGLEAMALDQLTIETADGDWPAYYEKIRTFLGLEEAPPDALSANPHLTKDADTQAELIVANRSGRSLIAYRWPYLERFAEYAFELINGDTRTYPTTLGHRFRLHDTNTGAILRDVFAAQPRQEVIIDA